MAEAPYAHRRALLDQPTVLADTAELLRAVEGGPRLEPSRLDAMPFFQALSIASASFAASVTEAVTGPPLTGVGRREKLVAALRKYSVRAQRRATPFGTFAGAGLILDPNKQIGDGDAVEMHVGHEDASRWHPFEASPAIGSWIVSNQYARLQRDELAVDSRVLTDERKRSRGRLRATAPVREVWEIARTGVSFSELLAHIGDRYGASTEKIVQLVEAMIRAQIVFSSSAPTTVLEVLGCGSRTLDPLQGEATGPRWVRATPVQGPDRAVARRIDEVVRRLALVERRTTEEACLDTYSNAFLSRYGMNVPVRVLDACDPIGGIGFAPRDEAVESWTTTEQRRVLQELIVRGSESESFSVEITSTELAVLSDPKRKALDYALDVVYRYDAESDRMDFGGLWGTSIPAQSLGRFWQSLPARTFEAASEQRTAEGDPVTPVTINFLPHQRRHLNVMNMPQPFPHHVCLDFPCGGEGELPFDLLYFVHDGAKLQLRHPDVATPLAIRNLSMFNIDVATDLARTIVIVGREQERDWIPFSWGDETSRHSSLPEVSYRGVVLSKAGWRVPARLADGSISSAAEWRAEFDRWRSAVRAPRFMEVGTGDTRLVLDSDDTHEADLVRLLLDSDEAVVLRPGVSIDSTALEYVQRVRVKRADQPDTHPFAELPSGASGDMFAEPAPLEDWVSAELFSGSGAPIELRALVPLVRHATALGADDWHFLHYTVPDRHLRWRARLSDPAKRAEMRAEIARLSRHVYFDARLTTFRPEYRRYGGQKQFAAVSRAFTLSSISALTHSMQPESQTRERALPFALGALEQLLAGTFGESWKRLFVDTYRHVRTPPGAPRIIPSAESAPVDQSAPQPLRLDDPSPADEVSILLGLVHMHSNRFFGPSQSDEVALVARTRQMLLKDASLRSRE